MAGLWLCWHCVAPHGLFTVFAAVKVTMLLVKNVVFVETQMDQSFSGILPAQIQSCSLLPLISFLLLLRWFCAA